MSTKPARRRMPARVSASASPNGPGQPGGRSGQLAAGGERPAERAQPLVGVELAPREEPHSPAFGRIDWAMLANASAGSCEEHGAEAADRRRRTRRTGTDGPGHRPARSGRSSSLRRGRRPRARSSMRRDRSIPRTSPATSRCERRHGWSGRCRSRCRRPDRRCGGRARRPAHPRSRHRPTRIGLRARSSGHPRHRPTLRPSRRWRSSSHSPVLCFAERLAAARECGYSSRLIWTRTGVKRRRAIFQPSAVSTSSSS